MTFPVKICRPVKIPALLAVIFLGYLHGGFAQEASEDVVSFSTKDTINERIIAVREEIANLPADADESLRERLRQLEAATSSHLSGTDFLEAAREQVTQAKQQASAWQGFPGGTTLLHPAA